MQPWIKKLSNADLLAAVQSRLQSAVTHFDGTFAQWTVANETLHTHFFDSRLGSSILPWMYEQVRELDPDVKLFVNEYNTIEGNDTTAYKAQIQMAISPRCANRRHRRPGALCRRDQSAGRRSAAQ